MEGMRFEGVLPDLASLANVDHRNDRAAVVDLDAGQPPRLTDLCASLGENRARQALFADLGSLRQLLMPRLAATVLTKFHRRKE